MTDLKQAKISKHYNKLVIVFIVLTLALVLFIGYFAFSKTIITVTTVPQEALITYETNLGEVQGKLFTQEVEGSGEYTDLKGDKEVIGKASGLVTIYNNYSADQPLVATTRLLSESGVLFRTTEDVVVPKDGSVEVLVEADEEGADGDIEADTFEIVALNAAKKEAIYAESTEAMTGGKSKVSVLTQNDLANAKEELVAKLKTDAHLALMDQMNAKQNENLTLDANSLKAEVLSEEYDKEAGTEASSVTVTLKVKVVALAVDKEELLTKALEEAGGQLSSDLKLTADYSKENISYKLKEYDLEEETANLKVSFNEQAVIHADSSVLDKSNLMGKSAEDVVSYLEDLPEIETASVEFSPAWVTKVPNIEGNIKIIVN